MLPARLVQQRTMTVSPNLDENTLERFEQPRSGSRSSRFGCVCLCFLLTPLPLSAQQTTGLPGSPGATTTIDGKQLPAPDPKFGGVIKENVVQSKPWWAPRVVPPEGAPNVLLIMTDDVGFGAPGTFGGVIPLRRWTGLRRRVCATRNFVPRRSPRRRVRRSLRVAIIILRASASSRNNQQDSPATTASSRRT